MIQRCARCGWVLKKIKKLWYCTNADCYYNTNAHRCDR
jgi:hypothetical protein